MDTFISDFLYAFRVFFKRPGLTILAIVALSLSLGMSVTAFSTLNGMFFKPLPFKDPDSLQTVFLVNTKAGMKEMAIPLEHYDDLKELDCFTETMAYFPGTINISGKGHPERYNGGYVTTEFPGTTGVEPILGRSFSEDPFSRDGQSELMISHKAWQNQFLGDPDIIGKVVRANGIDHEIIAVLPEGFHFVNQVNVWMPVNTNPRDDDKQHISQVFVSARISPDFSDDDIQATLDKAFAEWTNITLEDKADTRLTFKPFGKFELNSATNSVLVAALGAVIFVLLVSCANVANLLVGRALSRGREMAIRSAIGASRGRIIRQLLTESLVLSFFGAIGGLIYAAWAVDASMSSSVYEIPYWMSFELDWRVFTFAIVVMVSTALISGLIPAWQSSKVNLNEMLKDTSHTSTSFRLGRMTRLLAIVQIAFSCALLFGAGLITRNVYKMANIDPGYNGEEFLTMRMGLFPADYPTEPERDAFFKELTRRVKQVPGVDDVAVTSWIAQHGNYRQAFLLNHDVNANPEFDHAYSESVSKDYFDTYGLAPIKGEIFDDEFDNSDGIPVVVNQAFAETCLAGVDPIGHKISKLVSIGEEQTEYLTVTGVVPTIRVSGFTKPTKDEPIVYLPYTATESTFMSLVVRTGSSDMDELKEAIQNVILAIDPNLPVYFTKTMKEFVDDQIYPFRMMANFFLVIGLMALFLSAIGVYGMLAFNVSRRRREIGIRMALGASTFGIVSQVLRQGFIQLALGLLIGTGLAFLVGQLTRDFLFGVNPTDPSVYFGVLLTLFGVATLAFFIPARRAANLSPLEALRYE